MKALLATFLQSKDPGTLVLTRHADGTLSVAMATPADVAAAAAALGAA
jgi:hypothetical protein